MLVSNVSFKECLSTEVNQWIQGIGRAMHSKYRWVVKMSKYYLSPTVNLNRRELDGLYATISDLDKKLDRSINDLDDIRIIMETQQKMRDIEIDLDMKIDLVQNAFAMMVKYDLQLTKDDVEKVEGIMQVWLLCQHKAVETYVLLLEVQEQFKEELIKNVQVFQLECEAFCEAYATKGPMEVGLSPREASDRLEDFQNQFDTLYRKHTSYAVGEDLFGLPHTDQSEIEAIKKELNMLQRLYKLYNDVIDSVAGYKAFLWKNIDVDNIGNELMEYQNRCRKLPKGLKVNVSIN